MDRCSSRHSVVSVEAFEKQLKTNLFKLAFPSPLAAKCFLCSVITFIILFYKIIIIIIEKNILFAALHCSMLSFVMTCSFKALAM